MLAEHGLDASLTGTHARREDEQAFTPSLDQRGQSKIPIRGGKHRRADREDSQHLGVGESFTACTTVHTVSDMASSARPPHSKSDVP